MHSDFLASTQVPLHPKYSAQNIPVILSSNFSRPPTSISFALFLPAAAPSLCPSTWGFQRAHGPATPLPLALYLSRWAPRRLLRVTTRVAKSSRAALLSEAVAVAMWFPFAVQMQQRQQAVPHPDFGHSPQGKRLERQLERGDNGRREREKRGWLCVALSLPELGRLPSQVVARLCRVSEESESGRRFPSLGPATPSPGQGSAGVGRPGWVLLGRWKPSP